MAYRTGFAKFKTVCTEYSDLVGFYNRRGYIFVSNILEALGSFDPHSGGVLCGLFVRVPVYFLLEKSSSSCLLSL